MSSWEFFIWNSISRDSDGIFSKISPKQLFQSTFLLNNFQYKLMNTRTLVKPIIICLLFAEIFMVGLTMLKIVFTIRIYLQDEQNPLSGFGRILFGPRSFRGCGSPTVRSWTYRIFRPIKRWMWISNKYLLGRNGTFELDFDWNRICSLPCHEGGFTITCGVHNVDHILENPDKVVSTQRRVSRQIFERYWNQRLWKSFQEYFK